MQPDRDIDVCSESESTLSAISSVLSSTMALEAQTDATESEAIKKESV